jgi:hypothetical protein
LESVADLVTMARASALLLVGERSRARGGKFGFTGLVQQDS